MTSARKLPVPIRLCETTPTDVVPADYVAELWAALDQTLQHSGCGVGSDIPVDQGGALDMNTYRIVGVSAPVREPSPNLIEECLPSPYHHHESLPELELSQCVVLLGPASQLCFH